MNDRNVEKSRVAGHGRYAKSLIMESSRFERAPTAAAERLVPFLTFT
jgi:hypothetical protein